MKRSRISVDHDSAEKMEEKKKETKKITKIHRPNMLFSMKSTNLPNRQRKNLLFFICFTTILVTHWIVKNKITTEETTEEVIDRSEENYHPINVQLIANDLSLATVDVPKSFNRESKPLQYPMIPRYKIKQSKLPNPMLTRDTCTILDDWQLSYHPSCNLVHEIELLNFQKKGVKIVDNGAFRDVWRIPDFDGSFRVLKTLRYTSKRYFDHRNFDRHRRDAISFEELSSSPYVVNIYGHCSNSALFDFCGGGNLYEFFHSKPSTKELLQVAYDVAVSVADAHNFDSLDRPTIAHTDIKPDQWILGSDGHYRLNDFNRARFLGWDQKTNSTCPYFVGKNVGIWRSPEEYSYKGQTHKVDVWSLGNVLYYLVARKKPYTGKADDAIKLVKKGGSPRKIRDNELFQGIDDPREKEMMRVMRQATEMCFVADPNMRPEAREIADVLKRGLVNS